MAKEQEPADVELASYQQLKRIADSLEKIALVIEVGSIAAEVAGHVNVTEVQP